MDYLDLNVGNAIGLVVGAFAWTLFPVVVIVCTLVQLGIKLHAKWVGEDSVK